MKKNKNFIKGIIVILCLSIISGIVVFHYLAPRINVYQREVNVNIYSDYIDNNYYATYLNNDISDKVIVDGIVDTNNMGSYKLTYNLKEGFFNVNKEVIVNVIDSVAPTIELKGDKEYKVCSIDKFEDPGYMVYDNYDKELDDKVKKEVKDDKIIYEVKDSSNNIGKSVRNIIITDDEKPIITLNGSNPQYVLINSEYEEKGVKVNDNCDGDITDKVEISGSVDTSKKGTYEITYKVSDLKGNEAEVKRKVSVIESNVNVNTNNSGTPGVIYMTFDDGPGSTTNKILDVLAKYNVKGTFFVTNGGSDEIIKREYDEGHTVALHTATHQWSIYKTVDTYFADLESVKSRVKRITGEDAKNIRFPGGSSNTISKSVTPGIMSTLVKEVEARGYRYFDWNVDLNDAGACSKNGVADRSACVFNYFKKYISKSHANYVLCHDIKSYTANAMEDIIKYGLANGYTFLPITDDTPTYHHRVNN